MNPHHIQQAIERTQTALIIATSKPAPRGDNSGGGGATEAPLPLPVGVISAKRELRDLLVDWVTMVSDPRDLDIVAHCDKTESDMLRWLGEGERAEYLAAHDAAMDFLEELTAVTKQIENPYLPRMGRKYLGFHGGGDVYVKEGQTEITLADGTIERVDTIRTWSAQHVLNWTGTAQEVAKAIKDYFGHDIAPTRIKDAQKYDRKKPGGHKLEPLRTVGKNHIYRVGDVLDRLVKKEISPKT